MCIRDSDYPDQRRRARCRRTQAAVVRLRTDRTQHGEFDLRLGTDETHPGTCLLYTSDAADERSSVDLGGRRIIKKKNSR